MMFGIELWSERNRRERSLLPDVFQYEVVSDKLRRQFLFICSDLYGVFSDYSNQETYTVAVNALRRGLGREYLTGRYLKFRGEEFEDFILKEQSVDHVLDGFDIILRITHNAIRNAYHERKEELEAAIMSFNLRCKQAGFGYAYESGQLIRIDSHYLHADAVIPTLNIISSSEYQSVNSEFRKAYEHWRAGNLSEVLVECLKAFESTMRIIAAKNGWPVPARPTASDLVKVVLDNGLIPEFYLNHFSGLRSVLQSGIPTPRNRVGGHGAGTDAPASIPTELVRYVLHQTAATILFLVEADTAKHSPAPPTVVHTA